ncbi:streptophobe family protein [Streptomyces solicamelliae]|uniref:streptophobe family protein n=1 Tax=Streptomyces solicamelliae TaxID=3231716 RepID=UPI00387798AD
MSSQLPTARGAPAGTGAGHLVRGWLDALLAVLAGFLAMAVVAALGLWAAGAGDLPDGAFPSVVAAVVVMAAGGRIDMSGQAGALAGTNAELTAMPLSVTLVGALVTGFLFLRPLRHHAVAGGGDLLARVGRTTVLWLAALAGVSALARHDFPLTAPTGDDPVTDIFGELLEATNPSVGFRAEYGPTLGYGLLWILGVLLVALLVSSGAPLPARAVRYHAAVRPAASAMLLLVLAYVVIGLVIGLVVAATRGHTAETFAVILLGLPNVSWLALGTGIGGSWDGKVDGPFGLPMPQLLDEVLRGRQTTTLDVAALAEQDARAWWLIPVAAVLLLAAAFLMATRSPAGIRLWQHALHCGVAFALTMLAVAPLTHVFARFGLSVLGIGDIEGFGGEVVLDPHVWAMAGLALAWGLVAGFLGGLLALRVKRHGEVPQETGQGGARS